MTLLRHSAVLALALFATSAQAALVVTQNTDIAGASAAFGTSNVEFDWDAGGSPGTASGIIELSTNYISGAGFDFGGPNAIDLAISGVENVTWNFAAPVSRIGFAMATGLGNYPREFDHNGATFNLLTNTGETGIITLTDAGTGYAAWIEIVAANPFSKLSFTEVGTNIQDQYWGDVFSKPLATPAVPEPTTWALLIAGFGMIGAAQRRRVPLSLARRHA